MLTAHLNALPIPKFVLIEDTVKAKGERFLDYLVKTHVKRPSDLRTHYFVFQRDFKRSSANSDIVFHDYSSDVRNWLKTDVKNFKDVVVGLSEKCVVIVDSLVHLIFRYGLNEVYSIFNEVTRNKTNIQQVATVLHVDLLEDRDRAVQYFHNLSTLYIELDIRRVSYTFKKSPRKIIIQIENYHFEDDRLVTETIKNPDKEIVDKVLEQVLPENLSTFKIGLSDKDKEARDKLVLPYLPKESSARSGNIEYSFDDVDDWDEEDPDDDLDI